MTTLNVDIPDIGDAKDVEVIEICVNVGDEVSSNDALIVIESEKASMEVPSPVDGTIQEIVVSIGDLVNTGDQIVVLDAKTTVEDDAAEEKTEQTPAEREDITKQESHVPEPDVPVPPPVPPVDRSRTSVYAGPAVRKLARELGVDLTLVNGSGARGRIVKDDVKTWVKSTLLMPTDRKGDFAIPRVELPDFTRFGQIEERPLTRIRSRGAKNLSRSWLNVVHVTQHEETDITELENFRAQLNADSKNGEERLTPLPFIIKACACTLEEFPQFNASIHPNLETLILKKYIHVGMAVDTPDGLVVPVIRDANKMGIREIARESKRLAANATEKKLKPDDLLGGSFTVSSLGNLGGTGFTPVVNAPEVAILGVARVTVKPVWMNGEFTPRKILPLSLSYDHRAINGVEGGRFVQAVAANLTDIRRLVL